MALLLDLADKIQGRTICALGDAAAMPTRAFVKVYKDEFLHHIHNKSCTVRAGGYSTAPDSARSAQYDNKMAAD